MSFEHNKDLLVLAHKLLGDLVNEVIFVGGATSFMYVDKAISEEIRPTYDVDCVVEVTHYHKYDDVQAQLRKLGFKNDLSKGAPICRFNYGELLVLDVMPSDPRILGFSNRWYVDGIKNKIEKNLDGKSFFVFPLEYYLASKFEAYNSRGKSDPRQSSDLEDIILVIDGIANFDIVSSLDKNQSLKEFLEENFEACKKGPMYEAISGFLNHKQAKINRVLNRMSVIK